MVSDTEGVAAVPEEELVLEEDPDPEPDPEAEPDPELVGEVAPVDPVHLLLVLLTCKSVSGSASMSGPGSVFLFPYLQFFSVISSLSVNIQSKRHLQCCPALRV